MVRVSGRFESVERVRVIGSRLYYFVDEQKKIGYVSELTRAFACCVIKTSIERLFDCRVKVITETFLVLLQTDKGGKFLKKLWCCVGGG